VSEHSSGCVAQTSFSLVRPLHFTVRPLMTAHTAVPLYVAQLVFLKINSQSPVYELLTFFNSYVSAICAVFATSIHSLSCVTREPWLIVFYSLEHRDLALAAINR
jgi:hypothetical protein